MIDTVKLLREHGVQPSAQRVVVAEYVLWTTDHPSADQVLAHVRKRLPMLSRATVYNTLNLFVEKKLLRPLILAEGKLLFDPNIKDHHHFIDDRTGRVYDVPWISVVVKNMRLLRGFDVREFQVVMRGRHTGSA